MDLINPFEDVVVFGKAYRNVWPVESAQTIAAIVPTGRHVSHANDLSVTRNSRGGGGRATRLEVYRGKKRGLRQGPFGKGLDADPFAKGLFGGGKKAAQVKRGLEMATRPTYTKDMEHVTMPLRRQSGGPSIRRRPMIDPNSPMANKGGRINPGGDTTPRPTATGPADYGHHPMSVKAYSNAEVNRRMGIAKRRNQPFNSSIPTASKSGRKIS